MCLAIHSSDPERIYVCIIWSMKSNVISFSEMTHVPQVKYLCKTFKDFWISDKTALQPSHRNRASAGTCCMATEHLCCHGQQEQSSMLKLSGELQRWTCSCLSWNLPRWEGTSFSFLSIMKTGLWKQDSGSTAENNRGLIGTQAKLCDIFLLQHSARLSVFSFCFVFFLCFFF